MTVLKASMGVLLVVCGGVAMAQSAATAAPQPVGRVKTLKGKASISTASQTVGAEQGTPVFQGSTVQTGNDSSLGLTFRDGTVLSLGADTRLTIDAYLYNPNQGQYRFDASLGNGVLNYLSGAIAKTRPDAVSVKTPSAVIGVRGTHFAVKAENAQ